MKPILLLVTCVALCGCDKQAYNVGSPVKVTVVALCPANGAYSSDITLMERPDGTRFTREGLIGHVGDTFVTQYNTLTDNDRSW